jgi:hypothetical protein
MNGDNPSLPPDAPDFEKTLAKAIAIVKEDKRISIRALKYIVKTGNDMFSAIIDEIVNSQKLAYIEDHDVLVWIGGPAFDLTFNEAHPPLMRDRDHFPPSRSDPFVVGVFKVEPKSFDRVKDPKYPCEIADGETVSPHEYSERMALRAKKASEAERYELKREKLWEQISRKHYSMAVQNQKTVSYGIHSREMTIQTESWGQRFSTS